MGKKRFISCCSLIEPTKETVKPNLTGEANFFGTLVISLRRLHTSPPGGRANQLARWLLLLSHRA